MSETRRGYTEVRDEFLSSTFRMAEDLKEAKSEIARLQEQVEALCKERDEWRVQFQNTAQFRDTLYSDLGAVKAERDRLSDELDNARHAPWPKWADEIRKCLESYGVDPGDEWNLPEQFEDWIAGVVEGETARAEAAEAERDRLREALRIIAGLDPCIDNLMGNADIARAALQKEPQP